MPRPEQPLGASVTNNSMETMMVLIMLHSVMVPPPRYIHHTTRTIAALGCLKLLSRLHHQLGQVVKRPRPPGGPPIRHQPGGQVDALRLQERVDLSLTGGTADGAHAHVLLLCSGLDLW